MNPPTESTLSGKLSKTARDLYPGYFAYAMATGIVALDWEKVTNHTLALGLFSAAVVGYAVLWVFTIWRLFAFQANFRKDFSDFARGPGFFTIVAGTNVVGRGFIAIAHLPNFAWVLWMVSWILWALLLYGFAGSLVIRENKPAFESSINGAWLIMVVATQSLCVTGSNLADHAFDPATIMFLCSAMFMLGCAMYLVIISMLIYRLLFFKITPQQFVPAYWVCMGAAAISTLAGAELDKRGTLWSIHVQAQPVLQAFTLLLWIVATAWIPMLLLLGYWKHVLSHQKIVYEPQYWSLVFPLGMYALATINVGDRFQLKPLGLIGSVFMYAALGAWVLTFYGLIAGVLRTAFERRSSSDTLLAANASVSG